MLQKISELQEKIKYHLFEKNIENQQLKMYRKEKRYLDKTEIQQFKFYLFMIYSLALVIPIIFLFSVFL